MGIRPGEKLEIIADGELVIRRKKSKGKRK
jgi:bifunctional DNA-binding transcriptional regulator/antitoxin component of YhaV-PrlF toxin-antitoxin module